VAHVIKAITINITVQAAHADSMHCSHHTDCHTCDVLLFTLHRHSSAAGGKLNVVEYLVAMGAVVNARDRSQRYPIHDACESGAVQVVSALLDAGAMLEAKDAVRAHTYSALRFIQLAV
jgi:ankyrin repeat protein